MPNTTLTSNINEFSVSEISSALKRTVEDAFGNVRIRGEISGFKKAASGHLYFSLKDEKSVLNTICWRGVAGKLPLTPEDGLEVIATGRISTYPGRSNYQLIVDFMEPAGVGALMALLEKRKAQLAKEGLFDESRKKSLPFLPQTIGVITSPTGAVIRDILHRITDRFPVHVLVWPVLVQGEGAAAQITEAIEGFNTSPNKPDLLIIARGGGSIEDLWAFNEENVVRAATASDIPLISAVGHETDTTLIDYVADRRAPTPTAAAEIALPVKSDLLYTINEHQQRIHTRMQRIFEEYNTRISGLARGLLSPKRLLENMTQRLDDWSYRLTQSWPKIREGKDKSLLLAVNRLRPEALTREIIRYSENIATLTARMNISVTRVLEQKMQLSQANSALLESFHYKKVLERGFVLVRDSQKNVISSAGDVVAGENMLLEFKDGTKNVTAKGKKSVRKTAAKHRSEKTSANNNNPNEQGSLF